MLLLMIDKVLHMKGGDHGHFLTDWHGGVLIRTGKHGIMRCCIPFVCTIDQRLRRMAVRAKDSHLSQAKKGANGKALPYIGIKTQPGLSA